MKIYKLLPFYIVIANAMNINKEKNEIYNITPTSKEPTKIEKRAMTPVYEDIETLRIIADDWDKWDENWDADNWSWGELTYKVIDGVIVVKLKNGAGFSINNNNLESEYGVIDFDYKIETAEEKDVRLNFISFYEKDYVNQGNWLYKGKGEYEHITKEIKDHSKNTYIPRIQRFAWQNYNNDADITLYLKNITYTNKRIVVMKYDAPVSIFDSEGCKLNPEWKNISKYPSQIKFSKVNNECVMTINASVKNPVNLELDNKKFKGGKLEITLRSSKNNIFIWTAYNTEDSSISIENAPIVVNSNYEEHNKEDFENEKVYNALKIEPGDGEASFEIIAFKFYPITLDDQIGEDYELTIIDEPDVILDELGLHWNECSWKCICKFNYDDGFEECVFNEIYSAFSFQTSNNYNAGTLLINMRSSQPDNLIQIQTHHPNGDFENVESIQNPSTDYTDYYIKIPDNKKYPTNRFAIQEASKNDDTIYIRKIVYYPSYIPLDPINTKTRVSTRTRTTTSRISRTSSQEPTLPPKTNEDIYQDNGYEECSPNAKIAYVDRTTTTSNIYGFENNGWCGIFEKNINSCWSSIYGINCCTSSASVKGAWGTEPDGTKCGSNNANACWSTEMGYDCCTRNESSIIFVDEDGAWGTKNGNWCGIK